MEREYDLRRIASYWIKMYGKECKTNTKKSQEEGKFSEYLKIKKENEELKNEVLF